MKQEEQKRVIQDFRAGTYNVLVCTCIGEEGLDIGEVDLIVNFDCLSSPIRMIQRVGRTGRKRNGASMYISGEFVPFLCFGFGTYTNPRLVSRLS